MATKRGNTIKSISRDAKKGLTKVKSGLYVGCDRTAGVLPATLTLFGCQKCAWIGTLNCPHGKKLGEHHANWICSERVLYIQSELKKSGSMPKLIQQEEIVKLKLLCDSMLFDYTEGAELHEDYKHLSKNLSSFIDKMRRQDEGIKMNVEVSEQVKELKNVIDTQAESVKDKDIVKEAEFIEETEDEIVSEDKLKEINSPTFQEPPISEGCKIDEPKISEFKEKKIIIVGYPKTGKTTYSARFDNVLHTDDYKNIEFKEQVYKILEDIKNKDEYIIEGVQGFRLFRKMLQNNESIPDKVIYLKPKYPAMEKHISMRKMLDKVWLDCLTLNKTTKIEEITGL